MSSDIFSSILIFKIKTIYLLVHNSFYNILSKGFISLLRYHITFQIISNKNSD